MEKDAIKFMDGLGTAIEAIKDPKKIAESAEAIAGLMKRLTVEVPATWAALQKKVEELPKGSPIRAVLEDTMRTANGALDVVEKNFETWYASFENQVTAWYRQKTHLVLMLIAVVVVCLMNVDTLELIRQLSINNKLREAVVVQALAKASSGEAQTPEGKQRDGAYKTYVAAREAQATKPAVPSSGASDGTGSPPSDVDELWAAYIDKQKAYEEALLASVKELEVSGFQFGWNIAWWKDLANK